MKLADNFNPKSPHDVLVNHNQMLEHVMWPMVKDTKGLTAVELHQLEYAFLNLQHECLKVALAHKQTSSMSMAPDAAAKPQTPTTEP